MKKIRSRRGFTIIELLIAIFVLEIGLLGIVSFYTYSFKVTKNARNQTTAANLAAGLLDTELNNSYDNLGVGAGAKVRYSNDPANPFYEWYKKVDVAYIDANLSEQPTDTHMKKIIVNIYWQEYSHEMHFQTATIKADH